jgi:hypothetical protein
MPPSPAPALAMPAKCSNFQKTPFRLVRRTVTLEDWAVLPAILRSVAAYRAASLARFHYVDFGLTTPIAAPRPEVLEKKLRQW